MIIQKADLFKDLSPETMNEVSKIMVEESWDKGSSVFSAGNPAKHFYILVDGTIRLSVGSEAEIDYTVSRPGEAFGWSGMVDRPVYMATAECLTPCKLIKIDNEKLNTVLGKDSSSGMKFYKCLASCVVQRLVYNYGAFLSEGSLKGVTASYGAGHMDPDEE
jgi:CRP/FNR family transcriptional regulator, cyclic AMP receptor protein